MAIGNTRNPSDASSHLHIGVHQAIIALRTSQWLATMPEAGVIHRCTLRVRTIGATDGTPLAKNATYLTEGQRNGALG